MTALVDVVATRLSAQVPALTGRIEYILELAALVAEGAMPQREVSAFVVMLGSDGQLPGSISGIYTQMVSSGIGVVLCIKALGDAKARRAIPTIDALEIDVKRALAGWSPSDDVVGVFVFSRSRLVSVNKGLVIYQIDFTLLDQMRITL